MVALFESKGARLGLTTYITYKNTGGRYWTRTNDPCDVNPHPHPLLLLTQNGITLAFALWAKGQTLTLERRGQGNSFLHFLSSADMVLTREGQLRPLLALSRHRR